VQNTLKKKEAEWEKAATEAAYRRSEEQYRLITENTRDLICLLDLQFNFLYASPSYQLVLGHAPASLMGQSFWDFIHPEDVPLLKTKFEKALHFRQGRTAELHFRHTSGACPLFESAVSFIFDEAGQPQRALMVSRDITERKRAEREIRKLAAFPRFNPNPVLEFASDGSLTYYNDAALQMAKSLGKDHPQAILPLGTATIVRMCLSTGQNNLRLESIVNGRNLSWSFFPILGHHVVHCYAEDSTESLNLEAQLRQAQKMESVGQLAAGVAHDFNNILTIIQGHAGLMLSDKNLAATLGESAKQISLAAERAANLTRQLLTFSRKQIMQPQLLDLNEVITNVSKMLRALVGEPVTLRRTTSGDLPAIHADAGMLEQVLVNLAVNARDAMANGGTLTIHTFANEIDDGYVQRHPEARTGYFVCLSVTDTGCGMDAATFNRIFEPFFTTKEVGKGTGLGLATVYGIVKQHQGWAEVESQVGQGTTFKVFLPAACKAAARPDTSRPKEVAGGDETILVVEDELALRELVQEILQKKGYTVLEASTGTQALKIWQQHRDEIDLLLTDMMMPESLSGRELAEKVLAEKPSLKVLYTSGYSLDVVSPGFTLKDGLNFLQKPYHPETLIQMVRDCLDR
jgi:PAS domain S-box-containing protein